jgi:hypothetical protein
MGERRKTDWIELGLCGLGLACVALQAVVWVKSMPTALKDIKPAILSTVQRVSTPKDVAPVPRDQGSSDPTQEHQISQTDALRITTGHGEDQS